jgi:hypothetical protein
MSRKWTEKEEQRIRRHVGGVKDLAEALGRTEQSVRDKIARMRGRDNYQNDGQPWTDEEKIFLLDNLNEPNCKVCKRLQRGPKAVNAMRHAIKHGGKVYKKAVKAVAKPAFSRDGIDPYVLEKYFSSRKPEQMKSIVQDSISHYLDGTSTRRRTNLLRSLGILAV